MINNLQRTCSLFLVKTFFAVFFTVLFFILSIVNNNISYPFLTNNMYIWEFALIGVCAFFLALQPNRELISGKFLKNIFRKSVPAAITIIIAVCTIFLMYFLQSSKVMVTGIYTVDAARTMCVISFTIIAIFVLLKICLPLDKYRWIVFGGCSLIAIGCLVVSAVLTYNVPNYTSLFRIDFKSLSTQNYIQMLIIITSLVTLYLSITHIAKILLEAKKNDKN